MNFSKNLRDILFLDIETVPQENAWEKLSEPIQELFAQKTAYQRNKDELSPEEFYERAGIWAEFGKIICISVAYFNQNDSQRQLRVKSFYGDDEKQLLIEFKALLESHFSKQQHVLCAHNGKEFDFPYIARRVIVNQIDLPAKLNLFGKKPWEVSHMDTMELWKFGDYKHYSSLKLLTTILGVPSPKDDIDGSEVAQVYYEEKDLNRIVRYCEKDTIAVAQLLLRFNNEPLLEATDIVTA
ncbi:3'-5' exonuclease [Polaribacter pacificus]|uniref:3'-5' exonuclease n=1 Tax=Polaribacter pacificus TaxID=1775173 RepID=A0A917HX16_9FLAO|nr:3'-5' exonuclease [Polaribacter pacificus]GGG93745.1 3'-5' exonuclease [Polaribacter pacificus]